MRPPRICKRSFPLPRQVLTTFFYLDPQLASSLPEHQMVPYQPKRAKILSGIALPGLSCHLGSHYLPP